MTKTNDYLDYRAREREKQASREADERALASGEKTLEQLARENAVFAQLARKARIDLSASRSLG